MTPKTATRTVMNHNCPSSSAGGSENLPLDETELCEERRLMESVRAGTGAFILEEARTCYEFSRWADVTLISSSDCVAIKVIAPSPPLTSSFSDALRCTA